MVHLIERDGLAGGVSCREVYLIGTCYRVWVDTWEWGGLWGQWLEQGIRAGGSTGGITGPEPWAVVIHAVEHGPKYVGPRHPAQFLGVWGVQPPPSLMVTEPWLIQPA